MVCPACGHENPATAQFCNACGARLDATCPACGNANPAESRFCNKCGAPLAPSGSPSRPARDAPAATTPAARHLGSAAALFGKPDEARAYFARALEICERVGHRPEAALTHLALAELLLHEAVSDQPSAVSDGVDEAKLTADKLKAEGSQHLDFAIEELRAMKMQPALERALRHKGLLRA